VWGGEIDGERERERCVRERVTEKHIQGGKKRASETVRQQCCSVLHCVAVCYSVLQCAGQFAMNCNKLLCVAVCYSVLQSVGQFAM